MGAIVGGATGASMTAIVMIFEMTRDYNVIVPLVLAVALATGIRRALIAENIYTIKLRHRGRPIPTIRHTNMYLVRQARELMNRDFIVLPIATSIAERAGADRRPAVARTSSCRKGRASPASRGSRPVPMRLTATPGRRCNRWSPKISSIAPETSHPQHHHQPHEPARPQPCHRRQSPACGIPRPEDVVGVIAAPEIAAAVIANHYA